MTDDRIAGNDVTHLFDTFRIESLTIVSDLHNVASRKSTQLNLKYFEECAFELYDSFVHVNLPILSFATCCLETNCANFYG